MKGDRAPEALLPFKKLRRQAGHAKARLPVSVDRPDNKYGEDQVGIRNKKEII
jgi:hypothetical protein